MKMPTKKGSELVGGGDYCSTPGTYHLLLDKVKAGLSHKDEPIDGATLEATVLDGSVKGQAQKKVNLTLWYLRLDKSLEEQDVAVRRLNNFALASNIMQPSELGKEEVEVNEEDADGHQIIVKLAPARKQGPNGDWVDDDKYLQISYSDIWHVDDPEVANVPKNQAALKTIDAKYRHKPEWFAYKKKVGDNGKAAGSAAEPANEYADLY